MRRVRVRLKDAARQSHDEVVSAVAAGGCDPRGPPARLKRCPHFYGPLALKLRDDRGERPQPRLTSLATVEAIASAKLRGNAYGSMPSLYCPSIERWPESTVNALIAKRMVKSQQMRWTPRGAHLLLQIRSRVLNGDLNHALLRHTPPADVAS